MGNLCNGPDPHIGSSAPSLSGQRAALAEVCDALGDLNSGVAEEFQRVAKSLQAISSRTREVTAHSKQAAMLAGGDEIPRAIEMLRQMVQDMERVQQVVDGSRDRMEAVLAELQEARSPLLRLPQHPRLLATIGVLSRIEAYRIDSGAVGATLRAWARAPTPWHGWSGTRWARRAAWKRRGGPSRGAWFSTPRRFWIP
ncbi:MAG TPA: hypothetical protein VGN26_16010 [Armatimonadota bacterium]|jgi:hypothetical protein